MLLVHDLSALTGGHTLWKQEREECDRELMVMPQRRTFSSQRANS
jgi:hypothetical protein